jgi:hypothetical protein
VDRLLHPPYGGQGIVDALEPERRRAESSTAASHVVHHVATATSHSREEAAANPITGTSAEAEAPASPPPGPQTTSATSMSDRARSSRTWPTTAWIPPDRSSVGTRKAARMDRATIAAHPANTTAY